MYLNKTYLSLYLYIRGGSKYHSNILVNWKNLCIQFWGTCISGNVAREVSCTFLRLWKYYVLYVTSLLYKQRGINMSCESHATAAEAIL